MKALLEGIEIDDVTIVGKSEGEGVFVHWTCPADNVNALELLKVRQAGFSFSISDGVCRITSRLGYTQFVAHLTK